VDFSFRSPKWASPLDGVVNLGMDTGFVGVLMSSLQFVGRSNY
jgi:hypothetical protein